MIESIVDRLTRASLRFKVITIALAVLALVAGAIALTQLKQELIPSIEFPTTIVLGFNTGAEPESMRDEVTIPIENAVKDIEGVVNVESTTASGVSVIQVQSEFGLDMEAFRGEITSAIGALTYPEGMETPELLTFGMDDLPAVYASVSSEELTLPELKALVEAEILPEFEGVPGVAAVQVSGGQELPTEPSLAMEGTEAPTLEPTPEPSPSPTAEPTATPTTVPTATPVVEPTAEPAPEPVEGLTTDEPGTAGIEPAPTPEPVALPGSWIAAAAAQGLTLETTADLTPLVVTGIAQAAPAMLNELTPEMLLAMPMDVLAALPEDYLAGLDPEVQARLAERIATETPVEADTGEPAVEEPEPVALPDSWIVAAAAQGQTLETTTDLTPEIVAGIAQFAPEMLADLTPEMLLAMPLDALAALPVDYLAGLDPEIQARLAERVAAAGPSEVEAGEPGMAEPEPVGLPESWIAAAAAQGQTLETTADLTPIVVSGIAQFAPAMLADLTPEMLLAMPPDALAALPEDYLAGLDPELQALLADRLAAPGTGVTAEGQEDQDSEEAALALPASWTEGAAARGTKLETTADLTPVIMRSILLMAPEGLAELTPEMLLAMSPDVLALLPEEYLGSLDEGLQAQIAARMAVDEAAAPEPTAEATPEPTADPAALPAIWQAAGKAQGLVLEMPEDVTPEIIQGVAEMAPQLLQALTPENLRRLSPEVLGWLPAGYVESLDGDLRAELDVLAQPVGGLGALAVAAEAEAEALSAGAPELSGLWREEPEEGAAGPMPTFETAADLMNSGFTASAAELLNMLVSMSLPEAPQLMADLTPDVIGWLAENEEGFLDNLEPATLRLLSPEVLASLPEGFYDGLDPEFRAELEGIAAGTVEAFIPTDTITCVDGNPSLRLIIFKDGEANTVAVTHDVYDKMEELESAYPGLRFDVTFEQASFIEESISGVTREGALGAIFAVLVILLFLSGTVNGRYRLAWRSTLVTAVSIPLSVFAAFALLTWLPPVANLVLEPLANATAGIPVLGTVVTLIHRMFPVGYTLNIMTLSGMTVAIGRVIDDSIVVLENIYRHMQRGEDRKQAVLVGTRDVSIAILASTVTTVIVFMPIGLVGGIIGEFFLPFGITVAYALGASFLVAVTIVPLLAYLFIRKEHLPEEKETAMQRWYTPALEWSLRHRAVILAIAGVLFVGSLLLLAQRPQALLPDMGEPQISVNVDMPNGTTMAETAGLVSEFEASVAGIEGLGTTQCEIGAGGGMQAMAAQMFGAGGIDQSLAGIDIGIEDTDRLDELTAAAREKAGAVFGAENVTVSGGGLMSAAFAGFSIVLSGDPDQIAAVDADVITTLEGIEGLANVSSNLADAETFLRVGGEPAVAYTGDVESADSMGLAAAALAEVQAIVPDGITVSQGFESEMQTRSFAQAIQALLISIIVVYLVLVVTFRSLVHPFTILFSLPLAIIGAAVALWLTDRVVGLPVLVGLMMLVGIVVTNAIVLIDRVQANRKKRGMDAHDALVEGGRTRIRPILMTAIATILALMPLAIGLTEGALIAAELATVVIGGLFSSTFLTLLIVPVMYRVLDPITTFGRKKKEPEPLAGE